jgi:hypothetical protein
VRVHDDRPAHRFARSIAAQAATLGSRIYFSEGRYQEGTHRGLALLGHELVHTLQRAPRTVLHRTPETEARLREIDQQLAGGGPYADEYLAGLRRERAELLMHGNQSTPPVAGSVSASSSVATLPESFTAGAPNPPGLAGAPGPGAGKSATKAAGGVGGPALTPVGGEPPRPVDLTLLSDAELMAEHQRAVRSVIGTAPGPDYDARVAYVRRIEDAVRGRPASGASASTIALATGPAGPQAEESFADVITSSSEAEGAPYKSGKTPLREGDIDRYGAFNTKARAGDALEGHEVLQNAFLKATGSVVRRGKGSASRGNPSIAVSEDVHARIDAAQQRLGLRDPTRLATMTADEVIAANAEALLEAGLEHSQIEMIKREAKRYAATMPSSPNASPAGGQSGVASEGLNYTPATLATASTSTNPELLSTPASEMQNVTPAVAPKGTGVAPETPYGPPLPPGLTRPPLAPPSGLLAERGPEVKPIENPALPGEARGGKLQGAVAAAFAGLNMIGDYIQASDAKQAWKAEAGSTGKVLSEQPWLGVLVVTRWSQVKAPWFSLNQPGRHFEGIDTFYAETESEARANERRQGVLMPGGAETTFTSDRKWFPPAAPGSKPAASAPTP